MNCTLKDVYIINSVLNREYAFTAERDPTLNVGKDAGWYKRKGIPWIPAFLRVVTFLKESSELPRIGVLC